MKKKLLYSFFINIFLICNILTISSEAISFSIDFEPKTDAMMLLNIDTETMVYEKNAYKKMYPASTTKIMTYIIVEEKIADIDNTTVTIKKELLNSLLGTGSSMANIKEGDVLTVRQLLYCLMVKSGNDAALVLADFIGKGNIESFVQMMNDKALALGCHDTHFVNPHGLHDDNHYTTAKDLAYITKHAMSLPNFMEITSTVTSKVMGEDKYPLITTNLMIDKVRGGKYYYQYAKGIKTGHTDQAGRCLVSSAVNNGYTYLCVALGAPSKDENGNEIQDNFAMLDSRSLYEWAFKNLKMKQVVNKNSPLGETTLKLSTKHDRVLLYPLANYSILLPKDVNVSSIDVSLNVPKAINAPVKTGQKIGTATLKYANVELSTIDVVANEDIEANIFLTIIYYITLVITSIWFIIALILVIVLIVIYFIAMVKYNKANKSRKKRNTKKKYKR